MRRTDAAVVLTTLVLLGFDWSGRIDEVATGLSSSDPARRREVVNALGTFPTSSTRRHLMRALEDPDTGVRIAASVFLARGTERAAVPTVIGWLSDPEASLREAACDALAQMADARAAAPLVRTLGDADADVRRAAVLALGALGTAESPDDVIVPLLGRLDDSHPRVREAAAEILGRLRDGRAVVPLIGKVQDLESEVRIRVIQSLAQIADTRAVPALLQVLRDPTLEVRIAATAALGRMRAREAVEPIVTLLDDSEPRMRQRAALALGEIGGDGAIAALARMLARGEIRRDAMEALAHIGPAAIPVLVSRIDDPRGLEVALAAVETLGRIGDAAAGPPLVAALQTGRLPPARLLVALGQVADPRALLPILERLGDRRPDVRLAAADALIPILERSPSPDGRAADPLLVLAGDRSEALRLKAVRLLGIVRAERAAESLLRIVDEDAGQIRLEAVRSLGRIRSARATPKLLALLDDQDPQLRTEVALAVGRVADRAAIAPLEERLVRTRPSDRAAVLTALGLVLRAHPDEAAIDLVGAMALGRDESLAVRAIDALARARATRGAEILSPILAGPDEWMRAKVAEALGALPGDRSRALLLRALAHDEAPPVRAAAAFALGRHPSAETTRALLRALRDDGWGVAPNAATALGLLGAREAAGRLCAALPASDPITSAALLRAAAAVGGACATRAAFLAALRSPSALPREMAARLLAGIVDPPVVEALRACADMDLDPSVGRACSDALRPLAAPSSASPSDWTEFYLYAGDGRALRPHARYLLVLPDGRVKAGVTDLHGFAREEPVPAGTVRVEDPDGIR